MTAEKRPSRINLLDSSQAPPRTLGNIFLQALGSEAHTERLGSENCTEAVFFHAETGEHIFCYGFSGPAAAGLHSSHTKDPQRNTTKTPHPTLLATQRDR